MGENLEQFWWESEQDDAKEVKFVPWNHSLEQLHDCVIVVISDLLFQERVEACILTKNPLYLIPKGDALAQVAVLGCCLRLLAPFALDAKPVVCLEQVREEESLDSFISAHEPQQAVQPRLLRASNPICFLLAPILVIGIHEHQGREGGLPH